MDLTTDVSPRISLSPVQVLRDERRVKRLKASLSRGVFSYANQQTSDDIAGECLKICGGSTETLSQVLQTKFFASHTPLYWAVVNRDSKSEPSTGPPLLTKLLNICNPLIQEAQEDVVDAFSREYHSDLYCALRAHLPDVPTHEPYSESGFFSRAEDHPVVTVSSLGADVTSATVNFRVPQFFSRLLVDGEVTLEFPVRGTACRLKMRMIEEEVQGSSQSHWLFEISEIWGKYKYSQYWYIRIDIFGPEEKVGPLWVDRATYFDPSAPPCAINVPDGNLRRLFNNPYTSSNNGELRGTFSML